MRCIGAAASLGYGLLLADVLAPVAMGEFAVGVSVAVIAATVAKCGLDAHLMRYAAERPEAVGRLAARCLAMAGTAGAVAGGVCVAIGFGACAEATVTFATMQVAVPFLAMGFVLAGLLKAGNLPGAAVFLETGGWQTAMCVSAVGMRFAGSDSLAVVAVCFTAGSALALFAALAVARSFVFGSAPSHADTRIRFREAAPLAAVSVCHVLVRWTDVLWLAWWFDATTVAVYAVCTRLAGGIAFVGHAVNAVAAPRFAHHHRRSETRALRGEFRRAIAISALCGTLGAATMVLLGPFVLQLLGSGSTYLEGVGILQAAAVLMAVHVTLATVGDLAVMSGRAADHLKGAAAMLLVQQAAYVVLIPQFGMAGALAGFALPQAFAYLLTLALLRRRREFGWLARGSGRRRFNRVRAAGGRMRRRRCLYWGKLGAASWVRRTPRRGTCRRGRCRWWDRRNTKRRS